MCARMPVQPCPPAVQPWSPPPRRPFSASRQIRRPDPGARSYGGLTQSQQGGHEDMGQRVVVTDVSKTYRLGKINVTALAGVSLAVEAGEFLAVAGPSGSGKTTLLNLIGCLDTPTSGEIAIDGEAIGGLSAGGRAGLRAPQP